MKTGLVGLRLFLILPLLVLFSPLTSLGVSGDKNRFDSNSQHVPRYLALQSDGITFDSNTQPSPRQKAIRIAAYLIHWVIVPLILVLVFFYALNLPYQSSDQSTDGTDELDDVTDESRYRKLQSHYRKIQSRYRKAGTAGIFAGLILFVIFTLTRDAMTYEVSFTIPAYHLSFWSIILLVGGAGLGFFIIYLAGAIEEKASAVAFLVMLLTAASLTVTYSYFLFFGARSTIVYLALGGMFGALIRTMVKPN